ncbi:MAG: YqjF family protein [Chthoniobacterales bacterium]
MSERLAKPFLTAEWRYLAMLNFAANPALLQPLVPAGTELDFHNGETFLSVVAFLFLNTRVLRMPIPFHRNFEEVNLRFYVRRKVDGEWRRGVCFVRELVPRFAIAFVARAFYGEPYSAVPMRHEVSHSAGQLAVNYAWRRGEVWESVAMSANGAAEESAPGSHEEFITEHYWGYTARGDRSSEYQVKHPRWRVWPATTWKFDADVRSLYGSEFLAPVAAPPVSAFIADGSPVEVRKKSAA